MMNSRAGRDVGLRWRWARHLRASHRLLRRARWWRLLVLAMVALAALALVAERPLLHLHPFLVLYAATLADAAYGEVTEAGAVLLVLAGGYALLTGGTLVAWAEASVFVLCGAGLLALVQRLRQAVRAARRAQQQAAVALHVRDAFLHTISHDLKNPLSAIAGHTALLRQRAEAQPQVDSARVVRAITGIAAAEAAMSRLINELLDTARVQAGQPLVLQRRPVDLVALTQRTVAAHQERTTRHQIHMQATSAEIVGVWDAFRLERVLDNLLSNAIKYSPAGGVIDVDVAGEANGATLRVRDRGIGIPASDLLHLFEPFHRASNVAHLPGTGLGLAGSRAIVEQHGGRITVESAVGRGTVVTVWLPRTLDDSTDSQS